MGVAKMSRFKALSLMIALSLLCGGCASVSGNGDYYTNQPEIAKAIGERDEKVMGELTTLAEKLFPAPVQQITVAPHVSHAPPTVCTDCGGPEIPKTDDVFIAYDEDGTALIKGIRLAGQDTECTQEAPCLETGALATEAETNLVSQSPTQPVNAGGGSVSLQQRFVHSGPQQGAGVANALLEVLKAQERTKQVELFVGMSKEIMLRPQHQQAAPWNPDRVLVEAVRNLPLFGSIVAGARVAEAGINAARGDVSANLNNGSSLATEAAGATGNAPVTTTKITTTEVAE